MNSSPFRMRVPVAIFLSVLLVSTILCPARTIPAEDPWFIDSHGKTGRISAQTSAADLVRIFGAKNVTDGKMELGEGETTDASIVFAGDSQRQIAIAWKDPANKKSPARIQVDGDKTVWHTFEGVTLGTTLKSLEELNGKAFVLAGFAWDYSGTVTSWQKGKLQEEFSNVVLRLSPSSDQQTATEDYEAVMGDRDFPSSHPAMQKINPKVYQIIWSFGE